MNGKNLTEITVESLKVYSQVWDNFWQLKESPLKTMKNVFYYTSKALSVLKIFKFLTWIFSHVAN